MLVKLRVVRLSALRLVASGFDAVVVNRRSPTIIDLVQSRVCLDLLSDFTALKLRDDRMLARATSGSIDLLRNDRATQLVIERSRTAKRLVVSVRQRSVETVGRLRAGQRAILVHPLLQSLDQ